MTMEIKQGDKVRVSKDAPKLIFGSCDMSQIVCTVCCIDKDVAAINVINDERTEMKVWIVPTKYLVKVDADAKETKHIFYGDYAKRASESLEKLKRKTQPEWYSSTEPTEQTEAENQAFTLGERVVTPYGYGVVGKDIEGRIAVALEYGGFCGIDKAIKIIADNPVFDWDAYTAALAQEVALKVANKKMDNHPEEIGAYAVSVANAVVEGLKRKRE